MTKLEKKKAKLAERIQTLEAELAHTLQKKAHDGQRAGAHADVDVPARMRQLQELREQLAKM
jgi:chaperonin cofactor prefoldin